jgi:hypothetical protein
MGVASLLADRSDYNRKGVLAVDQDALAVIQRPEQAQGNCNGEGRYAYK